MSAEEITTLDNTTNNETAIKKEKDDEGTQKSRKQSVFTGRIVEVREKKGLMHAAIPVVPVWFAWICLFFNVFVPGFGTFLISFSTLCGAKTSSKKPNRCVDFLINIAAAVLQLATAIVIVGWIFSISWGMNFVNIATDSRKAKKHQII